MSFLSHECFDLLGGPQGGRCFATDSQKGANVGTHIKVPPACEVQPSSALWNWREEAAFEAQETKTLVTDSRSGWYWYRTRFWSESEATEDVSTSWSICWRKGRELAHQEILAAVHQ